MKNRKTGKPDGRTFKKKVVSPLPLAEINPDAAGIDIGSASHYVAVPSSRSDTPVREFQSFTADMNALADWLAQCGITTVAMESTGVYWIPLFELLESRGFDVLLVNARHVKNVSGRKSDVLDCQWIQQLLSYGLLSGAYRPADEICRLRSVVRSRETLVRDQGRLVQRIQKAYTEMNIQLGNVLSDLAGTSGMAITRAILKGERDPVALAALCDKRVRSSSAQVAKSLEGNWRSEHLLSLRVAVNL
jgi:transposase